jgi:uncharacterized membrane protein YtjA (UPF0391 family)
VFEVLEVEAPVGYTGVFHVSAGLVPPLFVTVIVLAVVVSRNSGAPGGPDNDGGFPAKTVNVREAEAPAPFVAITVMLNAGVIVIPWPTVNVRPPTVTLLPASMVVAVVVYVIPLVRSDAAFGDVVQVIPLRAVGLV